MTVHRAPTRATKVPEIRTGDTVVVLVGKDAGKRGVVERVVRNPQGFKKTQAKYGSGFERTSSDTGATSTKSVRLRTNAGAVVSAQAACSAGDAVPSPLMSIEGIA